MLNRRTLAALVLVLGCRGREEYPRDVEDRFLASCMAKRPPGQEQLGAVFADYCRCTLEGVEARFSLTEFQALERRMLDGGKIPDELTSIAAACREKMIAK